MNELVNYLPYIVGTYEIFARVIPTKKHWSIVHAVFKGLVFVSKVLNVEQKKPEQKLPRAGTLFPVIIAAIFLFSCEGTKVVCLHQSVRPVTFRLPDSSYQTVNVPFCDTVAVNKIPKENKQ